MSPPPSPPGGGSRLDSLGEGQPPPPGGWRPGVRPSPCGGQGRPQYRCALTLSVPASSLRWEEGRGWQGAVLTRHFLEGNVLPSAEACSVPLLVLFRRASPPAPPPLPPAPGWPCPYCTRLHAGALAAGTTVQSWQASHQLPKEEQEALLPHSILPGRGRDTQGQAVPLIQQLPTGPSPTPRGQHAQACWQLCHTGFWQVAVALGVWPALRLGMAAGAGGGRHGPAASTPNQSAAEVAPQEGAWVCGLLCVLSQEMGYTAGCHAVPQVPRSGAEFLHPPTHPALVTYHPAGTGRRLAS